jgi:glycine/D-amino acid oxidase-like deaminating enzyme
VLVSRIPGAGSYVFEDTTIDTVDGQRPFVVRCGDYRITADHLVVATPPPGVHVRGLHLAPLTSRVRQVQRAVIGGTSDRNDLADGLYWEHGSEGGESLMVDRSRQNLDVRLEGVLRDGGGRDTIAGLTRRLCERMPGVRLTHQWTGLADESVDGLPCIGTVAPRQFVAAGLGDNDVTFGTLAGMMAADAVSGRVNPWRERLGFDCGRVAGEVPLRAATPA